MHTVGFRLAIRRVYGGRCAIGVTMDLRLVSDAVFVRTGYPLHLVIQSNGLTECLFLTPLLLQSTQQILALFPPCRTLEGRWTGIFEQFLISWLACDSLSILHLTEQVSQATWLAFDLRSDEVGGIRYRWNKLVRLVHICANCAKLKVDKFNFIFYLSPN